MAARCVLCGKGRMVGLSHRHHPGVAGQRWKKRAPKTQKIFKPNLHYARILINGTPKRVRLCTKCLRRAKEEMKAKGQVTKGTVQTETSVSATL